MGHRSWRPVRIATMPAAVKKGVRLAVVVAPQDDGILTHICGEIVAGLRDGTIVSEELPAAGKDPFQFLGIDIRVDEDVAADRPRRQIDEAVAVVYLSFC